MEDKNIDMEFQNLKDQWKRLSEDEIEIIEKIINNHKNKAHIKNPDLTNSIKEIIEGKIKNAS